MSDKEMVSAKIASRTKERLDEYSNREGISRSQAIGRMLKQGLDVEESDMRLVPVKSDGGTEIENRLSELDDEVQNIQTQTQTENRLLVLLFAAVVWLGINLTVELGTLLTVLTGIPLIAGLVYLQYRKYS